MCPFQVRLLSVYGIDSATAVTSNYPAEPHHRDAIHDDPVSAEGEAGPNNASIGREAPLPQV